MSETEKNAYESFVELKRLIGRLERPFKIDSSREMDFYQFGNFTIVKDDNFVCDECDGRKINFYVFKNGKSLDEIKAKKAIKELTGVELPKLEFIGNVLHRGLNFHYEYRVVTQPTTDTEDDSLSQDDYQPTDDDLNKQAQEIVKILL